MDKNFNDQELSDIMKEIEALEDGFKEEPVEEAEVLTELAHMKEAEAVPLRPVAAVKTAPAATKQSSMSFKVHGELHLDLEFEVGGKIISMNVSEDGLTIVMDGGMTFNVPMKKAA